MSDLISRGDAIKAVLASNLSACTVFGRSEEGMATAKELIQVIKNLPSVQPEPLTLRVNNELTKEEYDKLMQDIKDAPIVLLPSAQPDTDEWCHDCKEYDQEHNCCPRWNRVIKTALEDAQPEIIRCKDCKHKHIENTVWTCPFGLSGGENFFCGYGAEPHKEEQE